MILCVVGHCYDVTEGVDFYGVGKNYHAFVGRDGSTGFVSGATPQRGPRTQIQRPSFAALPVLPHKAAPWGRWSTDGRMRCRGWRLSGAGAAQPTRHSQRTRTRLLLLLPEPLLGTWAARGRVCLGSGGAEIHRPAGHVPPIVADIASASCCYRSLIHPTADGGGGGGGGGRSAPHVITPCPRDP
jgi:hypothetical protein